MNEGTQYSYNFELQLVKLGISKIIILFTFICWLSSVVLFSIVAPSYIDSAFSVLIFYIFFSSFILLKYFDLLFVKYRSNLFLFNTHFEIDNNKYYWENIEWYRTNAGSRLAIGISIGMKDDNKNLKIYAVLKQGKNLAECTEMIATFKDIIK